MPLIFLLFALAACLSSCESREDIFKKSSKSPVLHLYKDAGMSGVTTTTLKDTLRYGGSKVIYYEIEDEQEISEDIEIGILRVENSAAMPDLLYSIDSKNKTISFTEKSESSRRSPSSNVVTLLLRVTDYFGKDGLSYVDLCVMPNREPKPQISIEKISGYDYDLLISSAGSYDPDGDEIVLCEYAINSKPTISGGGYEEDNPLLKPGYATKDGTYIIGDSVVGLVSEVKFVNNLRRDVEVAVRCKDALGLWSAWKTVTYEYEAE